jgi:pyridoxamine 5'-phosphate oxidase
VDPIAQFGAWFDAARSADVDLPDACALATATPEGRPSARMVLLKSFDERGFVFATGYTSRKGRELAANPRAALVFHWYALGRQVRVEGRVEKTSAEESDAIFDARPLGSRISAAASHQSEPLASRAELEERVRDLAGADPRRPERWGGYRLVPEAIEFWEHDDDRLHHRVVCLRDGDGWRVEELQP